VDAQFPRFRGAPSFVAVMFASHLSFGLKIRVYWQKIHHCLFWKAENIRVSPVPCNIVLLGYFRVRLKKVIKSK